jgi:hypothetical protein
MRRGRLGRLPRAGSTICSKGVGMIMCRDVAR